MAEERISEIQRRAERTNYVAYELFLSCWGPEHWMLYTTQNKLLPTGTCNLRNFRVLIFRSDLHNIYLEMSRVVRIKDRTRWPANPEGFSVLFSVCSCHRCIQEPSAILLSSLEASTDHPVETKAVPPSRSQPVVTSTVPFSARNPICFPMS